MLRAVTAEQARGIEQRAVAEAGVELGSLMRAAGVAVAAQVEAISAEGRAVVLTGPGNNGGDGWVAARELKRAGREVLVVALAAPDTLRGIAAEAAERANADGVTVVSATDADPEAVLATAEVAIDAMLGTGARPELTGEYARWCRALNASPVPVVAVDLTTGTSADGGAADPDAVIAESTVTFTQPKLGLLTYPAAALAGEIAVADIGIPESLTDVESAPEVWTPDEYADLVPLPQPDAHKNSRGRLLIVAGSRRFPGAAVLAARAAMRAGAGYVTLAVPDAVLATVQCHVSAAPVVGLPSGRTGSLSTAAGQAVLGMAHDYDAVVLGPGITLTDGAVATARKVIVGLDKPLVVDADAINALVDAAELLDARTAPTVLTPHPGELARLTGRSAADVQVDRVSSAKNAASLTRVVVLKGAGTVIAQSGRSLINTSGTPALATAGSGDVLAGLLGGLLAQGLAPFDAAALAVYLHGRAGELAEQDLTTVCVNAEDLPGYLVAAFAEALYG